MAYKDGVWVPEDASVSSRVTALQSQDSNLMRGAIASGLKTANRRGLVNSSIGSSSAVGAGLNAATTIASQDASQVQQMNLASMEDSRTRDLSAATLKSNEKTAYANALTQAGQSYSSSIANTLQNADISAGTRSAAQKDIANLYTAQQQQLAQLYGVSLSWT
jgi:hypothetical protein